MPRGPQEILEDFVFPSRGHWLTTESGLGCGTRSVKVMNFEPRTISGSAFFSSVQIFRHGSLSERFPDPSSLLELAKSKSDDKHFDRNGPGISLKQETMDKAIVQTGPYC